jgi:hypothetical protein
MRARGESPLVPKGPEIPEPPKEEQPEEQLVGCEIRMDPFDAGLPRTLATPGFPGANGTPG